MTLYIIQDDNYEIWEEPHEVNLKVIGYTSADDVVIILEKDGIGGMTLFKCLTKFGMGWIHCSCFEDGAQLVKKV